MKDADATQKAAEREARNRCKVQHPRESLSETVERAAETVSAVSVSASGEVPEAPEAPEAQIVAAESAGATEGKVIAMPER